jgi:dipeptidase E
VAILLNSPFIMKLLLTSSGISNKSIHNALVDLLGKPIAECNALFIPTAIYPFPRGAYFAWNAINGSAKSPLVQLGWKALGLLELTALRGIDKSAWIQSVEETDVLLVWGGDPVYLAYWFMESGLAEYLLSLNRDLVYVGVSAGSMATAAAFVETYRNPPNDSNKVLTSEHIIFDTPNGEISRTLVTARGAGLVDFALIPHFDNPDFPDASEANAEKWAAKLPIPVYAIDDETAIKVVDGTVEVISEGHWKLFNA